MNYYHIWCDLRDSTKDLEFVAAVEAYLGHLRKSDKIAGHRLTRRKLGFGPDDLGEFHIEIQVRDLAQLDAAFEQVAPRSGEIEQLHAQVYSQIKNARFRLDRDFPDPQRAS